MATISDVAEDGAFGSARMVAGAVGISNAVVRVHVSEILDDCSVFQSGDLLVSTGYGLEGQDGMQMTVLRKLAQQGIAGIVFKKGQYMEHLCEGALLTADKLALPVFLAPVTFSTPAFTERVTMLLAEQRRSIPASDPWRRVMDAWPAHFGHESHVVIASRAAPPPLPPKALLAAVVEDGVGFAVVR